MLSGGEKGSARGLPTELGAARVLLLRPGTRWNGIWLGTAGLTPDVDVAAGGSTQHITLHFPCTRAHCQQAPLFCRWGRWEFKSALAGAECRWAHL